LLCALWIALQSGVKNWQAPGSGIHRAMLQIVAMKIRFAFTAAILAPKWAREIRMAGAPQSSKRIGFSECVRRLSITGYGLYYAGARCCMDGRVGFTSPSALLCPSYC
jgi:hypothetical protein